MGRENFVPGRRAFLGASLTAVLGTLLDQLRGSASNSKTYGPFSAQCPSDRLHNGVRLGTLTFDELEAPAVPFHRIVGAGLDARLFTDLSSLTPDTLVTSNDQFFIRTTRPRAARETGGWRIAVSGLVEPPRVIAPDELEPMTAPMGTHLLECAGNARGGRFGLISAARWDGVPVAQLFELVAPRPSASHVLISGLDDGGPSVTSASGASWVFTREQLSGAGAFFATRMNGEALPADHGAPVRLIVPGWYGCACIKWVNAVEFVDDPTPATTQMKEFAARTHQRGVPALAREYEPATIDFAAMPVRIEKWRVNQRILYNIVGIAWGGETRTPPLLIRMNPREPFVPINGCPPLSSAPLRANWTIWSHVWEPAAPGRYQIVLKADDPHVRTRRLDLYFYTRTVRVDEV